MAKMEYKEGINYTEVRLFIYQSAIIFIVPTRIWTRTRE